MDKNQEIFETVPIPKAVAVMAIPTIISMLVTLVYNMADTFFIGQTNNAVMVSAVSLTSPIFTLLTAFGNMFGIGGSTAISRSMGLGKKKTLLSIRFGDFKFRENIAKEVFSIGIPTALNSILTTTATIMMNRLLVQYGDNPVAAMGIAIKVNTMVIFIAMGLCAGVQPLLAYNYGSGNRKRLMGIFKFTAVASVVIGGVLTATLLFVREPVIRIFMNDDIIVKYGAKMFGILQISCPVIGLMFLGTNTLQAFGKGLTSLILSVCRQGLVYIPILFLFNRIFGMYGVVYAQPVADAVTIILVMIICLRSIHNMVNVQNQTNLSE